MARACLLACCLGSGAHHALAVEAFSAQRVTPGCLLSGPEDTCMGSAGSGEDTTLLQLAQQLPVSRGPTSKDGELASWLDFSSSPRAYSSSEDGALRLSPATSPQKGALQDPEWKLTIDDTGSGKRQQIDGFGAAWTDATVDVFDALPAELQEKLLEDLFGHSGIRLDLMRHTIGQSDLTPRHIGRWSYDENKGGADTELEHFNLTDVGRRMTSWISRMLRVNKDVTLFGSQWSPPGWMKQDNTLQWQYVDQWVQYMVKYLVAFKAEGVNVSAVTLQNEPLHNGDEAWTTFIDQSYAAILTNKLKPALKKVGLATEIWAYDHNTDKPDYPEYVLENAANGIAAVAWHCYAIGSAGWSVLSDFHGKHPDVKQYMTECWTHSEDESFWELPEFVNGPLQNYASGALAWTLGGSTAFDVAYPGGCDQCSGIIQVNKRAKVYEKTQDFYTLGQFSKFVAKGAVYLSNSGSYTWPDGTGVQVSSFLNPDGSRVVVILNKIRNAMNVQISFKSGDVWHAPVPGRAVSTWVLPAAAPQK